MKRYLNNKFLNLVLVTVLVLAIVVPGFSNAYADSVKDITITILSTSDIHGRYMPWDYAVDGANTKGSITQISTFVKEVRKDNPNIILLDAGDTIQDNSADLFQEMDPHPARDVVFQKRKYSSHLKYNNNLNSG